MDSNSRYTPSPQVVSRDVGDETVLLDLANGVYFGLDPVGRRIWSLLETGSSLGEICDALVDEYDVEREVLARDIDTLVSDLSDKNLLEKA